MELFEENKFTFLARADAPSGVWSVAKKVLKELAGGLKKVFYRFWRFFGQGRLVQFVIDAGSVQRPATVLSERFQFLASSTVSFYVLYLTTFADVLGPGVRQGDGPISVRRVDLRSGHYRGLRCSTRGCIVFEPVRRKNTLKIKLIKQLA